MGYYTYNIEEYEDAPSNWCTVTEIEADYAGIWNNPPKGEAAKKRIDCGTNEELFLALAALQDDTDENQWFVYPPTNYWFKCDKINIENFRNEPSIKMSCQGAWLYGNHKATVEELINHFK